MNRLRVEICGGIASGKTTLASLAGSGEYIALLETFEENPFWEAFFSNPGRFVFETEVSFLLQHYHQIKAEAPNNDIFICDYSFILDQAYADVGLNGSQHEAFERVHQEVWSEVGPPDLIILLRCSAQEELRRIRNRGRSVEESIDIEFLSSLNQAVYDRFEGLAEIAPSHVIDSTDRDFAHVKEEQVRVLRELRSKIHEVQDPRAGQE